MIIVVAGSALLLGGIVWVARIFHNLPMEPM